jgi:hypothetical protein
MTFGSIKTEIAGFIDRSDLTSKIPNWVNTALRRVEQDNDFYYMESFDSTLTIVDDTRTVAQPSDFKNFIWWYLSVNGSKAFLKYRENDEIELLETDLTPSKNTPGFFALQAKNFVLAPTSNATFTNKLFYHAFSAELSGDSDTNEITNIAPEILIYGGLVEGELYLVNDSRFPTWEAKYKQALAQFKGFANTRKWGSDPSMYRV